MGRPLKIKVSTTVDIGFNNVGSLTNPVFPETLAAGDYLGVVGGIRATATAGFPVVACVVNVAAGTGVENGVILRQKGTTTYLVRGDSSGVTGRCTLVNDATPAINEMCIQMATNSDSTLVNIKRLTNKSALDYSNIRYVINFFSDEGSMIKSGTKGETNGLGQIEKFTSA